MNIKSLMLRIAGTCLGLGAVGLIVLTLKDAIYSKPADEELRKTQTLLHNLFEKNKELNQEAERLSVHHVESLREIEQKEKELAAIKGRLRKITGLMEEVVPNLNKNLPDKSKQAAQPKDAAKPEAKKDAPVIPKPKPREAKKLKTPPVQRIYTPAAREQKAPSYNLETQGWRTQMENRSVSQKAVSPGSPNQAKKASPSPAVEKAKQPEKLLSFAEREEQYVERINLLNRILYELTPRPKRREENAEEEGYGLSRRREEGPEVMEMLPEDKPEAVREIEYLRMMTELQQKVEPLQEAAIAKRLSEITGKEKPSQRKSKKTAVEAADKDDEEDLEEAAENTQENDEEDHEGSGIEEAAKKKQASEISEEDAEEAVDEEEIVEEPRAKKTKRPVKSRKVVEEEASEESKEDALADVIEPPSPMTSREDLKEIRSLEREIKRDKVLYYYNLGLAYARGALYQDAVKMFEKALEINPHDAATHYNLGIIYDEYLGQEETAMQHYQTFLLLSDDAEKKNIVSDWIRLVKSKDKINKDDRGYFQSTQKAVSKLLFTKPE